MILIGKTSFPVLCIAALLIGGCATAPREAASPVRVQEKNAAAAPGPAARPAAATPSAPVAAPRPVVPAETPDKTAAEPVPAASLLCYRLSHPAKGGFLQPQSFVTSWYVYGPFKYDGKNSREAENQIVHHPFLPEERILPPGGKKSRLVRSPGREPLGSVDLTREFGRQTDHLAVYAVTCIYADREMSNLTLFTGSDDYIKIWINGILVHTYNRNGRPGKWDQDVIQGIKLHQGPNLVVVKSVNLVSQWLFFFRLADRNGEPFEFVPCHKPEKELAALLRRLRKETE